MTAGAVVPVFNRRDNLELLLLSLERQTTTDFVVVVADDGSTDGTRDLVEDHTRDATWNGRLRWVGCGPSQGVRTGRARNIGAANLPADTSLLVMLDSDLVLRPEAISDFIRLHEADPDLILMGQVDWLPPLERDVVLDAVSGRRLAELRHLVPGGTPHRIEGTFAGVELRSGLFDTFDQEPTLLRPEWALPLNSAWPLAAYWSVSGFDETMIGYGYQDMELGARAARAGLRCRAQPDAWALHVWHPKPPKAMDENQRNLDRYLRRNGHNMIIATDVDWTLWFHYHADRGGTVARSGDEIWAVDGDRRRRLALPDHSWLSRLGHCGHEVPELGGEELSALSDQGVARP